jgi:dienelactone hydrolase
MRRLAILVAGLTALASTLSGCIPPAPPAPGPVPPLAAVRDHAVGTHDLGFTDFTRATPAIGDYPGSAVRTIPTTVWYPAEGADGTVGADLPADRAHGAYPLVMFAHGFGVTPSFYTELLRQIASAGYVVAAPTYPILSGSPAGPSDTIGWDDTFADTRFATSSVLDLSATGDATLGGMIDPQRIAIAGHSDGALISFGDGFEAWRTDARIRAVISYAALLGESGTIYQPNGRAFLHFASDQDAYNDFDATIAWDHANLGPPDWTVALWNASHAAPYTDPSDPHFDLVARTTIDFLDLELKGQSALGFFLDVATRPDLAAFQ